MEPLLPQNDPNHTKRTEALTIEREKYQWRYYPNSNGIPMVEKVPEAEQPLSATKFPWVRDTASVVLRVLSNQALEDFVIERKPGGKLFLYGFFTWVYRFVNNPKRASFLLWLLEKLLPPLKWLLRRKNKAPSQKTNVKALSQKINIVEKNFRAYQDLFQIIYLPCISHHFQEDRVFAAQRVAGSNPLVIKQVIARLPEKFPVTDAQYQAVMGEQDSLTQAIEAGRLYLADYEILDGVQGGHFPKDYQKYLCAPLALFAVPQDKDCFPSLVPVAIQCHQTPGLNNPIFTPPPQGTPQKQQWSWLIAKTIVQIADGNYHELISHLGRTHLLIEPFAIATQRQLAPNHPLGILLRPHFEGTLFINYGATVGLINKGGTVDAVLGGTLDESIRLSVEGVRGYPFEFNDSMLPKTLESRGVNDVNKLPDYPYRDDGLLIWDAIHQWVSNYLSLYYHNDQDVIEDTELQGWLQDLMANDGGRMTGIGESTSSGTFDIHTKKYLFDAVTLIIFTSSAQHAAVNFPQSTFMTYGPNMPLAGYQPAPTTGTGATEADYFNLLPPLSQAEEQMNMTYPLGSVYYTQLGHYRENYFTDESVQTPLETFKRRLKEIETIIEDRNALRPTFYDFLHPSRIPQSINI